MTCVMMLMQGANCSFHRMELQVQRLIPGEDLEPFQNGGLDFCLQWRTRKIQHHTTLPNDGDTLLFCSPII